jgi:hypothetical protein
MGSGSQLAVTAQPTRRAVAVSADVATAPKLEHRTLVARSKMPTQPDGEWMDTSKLPAPRKDNTVIQHQKYQSSCNDPSISPKPKGGYPFQPGRTYPKAGGNSNKGNSGKS